MSCTMPHRATVTFANGLPNACSATVARLSPMDLATAKNGEDELSFTVGSAAIALTTSMPSSTVPTTTLVRSKMAAVSSGVSELPPDTVTTNPVPFGPGGGGSFTVTNLPFMLTSLSFGGGGGAPRSTVSDTRPARRWLMADAASSGWSASVDWPPGRPSTGVDDPGMTNALTPGSAMNSGVSVPFSSSYSTALISERRYPSPWIPCARALNRAAAIGEASPKTPTTTRPAGSESIAKSKKTLSVTLASSSEARAGPGRGIEPRMGAVSAATRATRLVAPPSTP
mmetsp:Transcript_10549/g.41165  ORF Transcript_10549/g.41165 Transcript_10549/m.41165 type:complete len:284 (-) Transcript_10549:137-988(-)